MSWPVVANSGILDIAPYVGGGSSVAGAATVVKLSSNEGALGPSPKAVEAYRAVGRDIFRYPDGGATRLRAAISEVSGLDRDRLICGSGSDELLSLLARCYAGEGDEVLHTEHGFLMYPICAKSVGAKPVAAKETNLTADVDALLAAVTDRTRVLFLANPNNPTGSFLGLDELERLRAGLPDEVLLVLDGAYAEYVEASDYDPGAALVDANPDNTVMTRTFSKIYALGGLRLGWAYGGAGVVDALNRIRGPFNVSAAALAAGEAAIRDRAFMIAVRDHTRLWRDRLTAALEGLGLSVAPSVCNFVLVEFPDTPGRDAAAADAFLKSRGVIVRRVEACGLPRSLRVTIGTEAETTALIDAVAAFRNQNP